MPTLPALLALAVAASPRPPSALDGCKAIPIEHGWQYDCADVRARLEDRPETGDAAVKYVAGMLQAAPAVVGEGAKTRIEKRRLGAGEVEVLVTEAPGKRVASFVAPISYQAGTRIVVCNGENARCARVLSGLSGVPWKSENARGTIRQDPAPLAIAGRAVKAPAGCEATTQPRGGRIVCAKTDWVGWVSMDEASARRMRTEFGAGMRKALDKPGWKTTESAVPCRLAGSTTTCVRALAESTSDALVVLWAIAPADQEFAFASCMAKGRKAGSPCSLVLEPDEAP